MKSVNKDIHQLAVNYFEGSISKDDERVLFDFVSENQHNINLFKNWEREWTASHQPQENMLLLWERLKCRISIQQNSVTYFSSSVSKVYRKKIWHCVSAVAAVFLIIFFSVSIYRTYLEKNQGAPFVFETHCAERSKVTLPDGTVVWLNAATTLSCPNDYNKKSRRVNLSGEAYFEVKKNEDIPFVVYAKDYPLLVKGTKFNVTAYPEEQVLTAALLEGLLQFGDDESGLMMHPDDVVTYNLSLNAKSIYSTDAKQFISWTEGRIEYDSITFDELFRRLSRQYDVDIVFTSERKTDKVLNISLNNGESITDVLDALSLIIPMTIERNGRTLTITLK